MMDALSEWSPIPSAPGYFIDRSGQIIGRRGRIMKPNIGRWGYPRVTISLGKGQAKLCCVHILACETFHGPKPSPKHQVAHRDGVRANPSADNLRWATARENTEDKKVHGTWPAGERNGRSLLTEADVTEIRKTYALSMGKKYVKRGTREALAARFSVNIDVIKDVVAGRSWRHVEVDLPFMAPPNNGGAHA